MVTPTVIVTGGAGFIGSHLTEALLQKKYRVIVLDIKKPDGSYFFSNHLDEQSDYRIVDIRDKEKVEEVFTATNPSYVIHLAAQPIVTDAYDNPHETFDTNVMGSVNILEACRHTPSIKRIIVASSDKAYGKMKDVYTEDSPLQGDHPYDVSKTCEDLIAQTYFTTYKTPVIITRFGNVYGEGDMHFDRIIPGMCESLVRNSVLQIRSDGTYVRDYVYVRDVVDGYMFLLETKKPVEGEAFNFSSDDSYSVVDLITLVEKSLGKKIQFTIVNSARNEIPYQHLNDTKIRKLGWKSSFSINASIAGVYAWYEQYLKELK